MPNFEFIASTVPEIGGGSHNSKIRSRDPLVTSIDRIFHFSVSSPRDPSVHAKYRLTSLCRSGDTEGLYNSKIGLRDLLVNPIDVIFIFSISSPRGPRACQISSF